MNLRARCVRGLFWPFGAMHHMLGIMILVVVAMGGGLLVRITMILPRIYNQIRCKVDLIGEGKAGGDIDQSYFHIRPILIS